MVGTLGKTCGGMERVGVKTQVSSPRSDSNHVCCDLKKVAAPSPCSRNGSTPVSLSGFLHQDSRWSLNRACSPFHLLLAKSFPLLSYETLPGPRSWVRAPCLQFCDTCLLSLRLPPIDISVCPSASLTRRVHLDSDPSVLKLCIWYKEQDPAQQTCAE